MPLSHRVLRALIAVPSVGLALLTALTGPRGTLVGAALIIVLTPFVVLDPASRLTTLLLALQGLNWVSSTVSPTSARDWTLSFVAALAVLTIHLAASLAVALPPAAPIPRATIVRWLRRALTVVGLSIPVWALLVAQTTTAPDGVPLITYAALAAVALAALAFWLGHASTPNTPASSPSSPSAAGSKRS